MISQRQIDLVIYMLNTDDWVTAEMMSNHMNLNKKIIQQEIREITVTFDDEIEIETNKYKGYLLKYISDQALGTIQEKFQDSAKNLYLPTRRSTFVLYLLYLKSYISMQSLADAFFMSKTAVSLEIFFLKRWINRYEGLTLEVNNKKGIKIVANEQRKRIYCSKHGTIEAFDALPFPADLKDKYTQIYKDTNRALSRLCVNDKEILVGEELDKIVRYLTNAVVRSKMGYFEEVSSDNIVPSLFCKKVQEVLLEILHYDLTFEELRTLDLLIQESNFLSEENRVTEEKSFEKFDLFIEQIEKIVKLGLSPQKIDKEEFLNYVYRMSLRYDSGDIATNYSSEAILREYPLESHLAYSYFSTIFELKPTKETNLVALFISSWMYDFRYKYKFLLIVNQNESVISHMLTVLKNGLPVSKKSEFKIMPSYQFEQEDVQLEEFDMCITTDSKMVLKDNSFFLVSPVLNEEEMNYVQIYLMARMKKAQSKNRSAIMDKVKFIKVKKSDENYLFFQKLIQDYDYSQTSFHTFSEKNLAIFHSGEDESKIQIYELESPIDFVQKRIHRIIYVTIGNGDPNLIVFMSAISVLLKKYR